MAKTEKKENAIRQSIRIDCEIEDAFRLFTEAFSDWWPLTLYSIGGDQAETCVIEPWVEGRVFERSKSGEEHEWGWVTSWDPPNRVSFAWCPAGTRGLSETVDVTFDVLADGTQVTVIHTGWDASGAAVSTIQFANAEMWPTLAKQFFLEFAMAQLPVTV